MYTAPEATQCLPNWRWWSFQDHFVKLGGDLTRDYWIFPGQQTPSPNAARMFRDKWCKLFDIRNWFSPVSHSNPIHSLAVMNCVMWSCNEDFCWEGFLYWTLEVCKMQFVVGKEWVLQKYIGICLGQQQSCKKYEILVHIGLFDYHTDDWIYWM